MTRSEILFYEGRGASVQPLLDALASEIDTRHNPIRGITASDLADGRVLNTARLLIMPGGEDKFYCRDLEGAGENNIRAAVHDGMGFLGNCAGSYYGGARIEYHQGLPDEVSAIRLGLVPVTAIGSIRQFGPAYDKTLNSASVVRLETQAGTGGFNSYYHGGPYFQVDPGAQVITQARYADLPGKPAAIVSSQFGKGKAVLTGAHIELSARHLSDHLNAIRDGSSYKHMVGPLESTDGSRLELFHNILMSFGVALKPQPMICTEYEAISITLGRKPRVLEPGLRYA